MALTAKQAAFVREYLIDLNATQAAIRAGYSVKTAAEIGRQNLIKVEIAAHIAEAQANRAKRTEITQDRVLAELAKIGFADIKSYVAYKTALTKIGTDDNGEAIIDYAHVIDVRDSEEVDGAPISEITLKDGTLKFKLHDKVAALEKIGRHLGMFNDKLTLKGDTDNPLQVVFNIPRPKGD